MIIYYYSDNDNIWYPDYHLLSIDQGFMAIDPDWWFFCFPSLKSSSTNWMETNPLVLMENHQYQPAKDDQQIIKTSRLVIKKHHKITSTMVSCGPFFPFFPSFFAFFLVTRWVRSCPLRLDRLRWMAMVWPGGKKLGILNDWTSKNRVFNHGIYPLVI